MSKKQQRNNLCTQHVLNLYFSCNSMNNLFSYNGLIDARIRAPEKDLSVHNYNRFNTSMHYQVLIKIVLETSALNDTKQFLF